VTEESALAPIFARAFHRAAARDASAEIDQMRVRPELASEALSYEIVLPESNPIEHLLKTVLPRLVYFLESRGARLPRAAGVFASVFHGEELYFVEMGDLIEELGKLAGLSTDEMVDTWGDV
jgi:hypothetical protein